MGKEGMMPLKKSKICLGVGGLDMWKLEFVHIRNKRLKGLLSQKTVGFNILADSSKLPHKGVLTLFNILTRTL